MHNQFYWINYNGSKEIACLLPEVIEDIDTGIIHTGIWRLASDPDLVLLTNEVTIIAGPLLPP